MNWAWKKISDCVYTYKVDNVGVSYKVFPNITFKKSKKIKKKKIRV